MATQLPVVMDRRRFVSTSLAAALVAPLEAEAAPAGRVARVALLATTPAPPVLAGLTDGLRQLGWVQGRNLTFEQRYSEGKTERFAELVAELIERKTDVIVTSGGPAALAAKKATRTVPVVMAAIIDPVAVGLVASLAKPGGNVTGISWLGIDLTAKRLELLKEAAPAISRLGVLFNPANPGNTVAVKEVSAMAPRFGMTPEFWEIRDPADFDKAFAAMTGSRTDALFTVADPLMFRRRTQIVDFAAKRRLPAIYEWKEFADLGGLMAYGVNLSELFRRSATFVDKILRGAKPAELPVEQITTFELVLNLKTARALGLTLPRTLLLRADQVIE